MPPLSPLVMQLSRSKPGRTYITLINSCVKIVPNEVLTKFKKSYPSVNPVEGSELIHAHSHVPAVSTSANPGATENDDWLSISQQYLRLKLHEFTKKETYRRQQSLSGGSL